MAEERSSLSIYVFAGSLFVKFNDSPWLRMHCRTRVTKVKINEPLNSQDMFCSAASHLPAE